MSTDPVPLRVIETPCEALQRLALTPDVPPDDLRGAIAAAVININERLLALEDQGRKVRARIGGRRI